VADTYISFQERDDDHNQPVGKKCKYLSAVSPKPVVEQQQKLPKSWANASRTKAAI